MFEKFTPKQIEDLKIGVLAGAGLLFSGILVFLIFQIVRESHDKNRRNKNTTAEIKEIKTMTECANDTSLEIENVQNIIWNKFHHNTQIAEDYQNKYPILKVIKHHKELDENPMNLVSSYANQAEYATIVIMQAMMYESISEEEIKKDDGNPYTTNDLNVWDFTNNKFDAAKKTELYKILPKFTGTDTYKNIHQTEYLKTVRDINYEIWHKNEAVAKARAGHGSNVINITFNKAFNDLVEKRNYVEAAKNAYSIQIRRAKGDGWGYSGGLVNQVTEKEYEFLKQYIYSILIEGKEIGVLKEFETFASNGKYTTKIAYSNAIYADSKKDSIYKALDEELMIYKELQSMNTFPAEKIVNRTLEKKTINTQEEKIQYIKECVKRINKRIDNIDFKIAVDKNCKAQYDKKKTIFYNTQTQDGFNKTLSEAAKREDHEELGNNVNNLLQIYQDLNGATKKPISGTIFNKDEIIGNVPEFETALRKSGALDNAGNSIVLNSPGIVANEINIDKYDKCWNVIRAIQEKKDNTTFNQHSKDQSLEVKDLASNSLFDTLCQWGIKGEVKNTKNLVFNQLTHENKDLKKKYEAMRYPIHTLSIMNALLLKIFTQIDESKTIKTGHKKTEKHKAMSQILNGIQTELSGKNILFSFQALAVNLFQYGHTDISNNSEQLIDACMEDLVLQINYFGNNSKGLVFTAEDLKRFDKELIDQYVSEQEMTDDVQNVTIETEGFTLGSYQPQPYTKNEFSNFEQNAKKTKE